MATTLDSTVTTVDILVTAINSNGLVSVPQVSHLLVLAAVARGLPRLMLNLDITDILMDLTVTSMDLMVILMDLMDTVLMDVESLDTLPVHLSLTEVSKDWASKSAISGVF